MTFQPAQAMQGVAQTLAGFQQDLELGPADESANSVICVITKIVRDELGWTQGRTHPAVLGFDPRRTLAFGWPSADQPYLLAYAHPVARFEDEIEVSLRARTQGFRWFLSSNIREWRLTNLADGYPLEVSGLTSGPATAQFLSAVVRPDIRS